MSMTTHAMKSLLAPALIIIISTTAAVTNDADGTAAAAANKWSTSAELADLLHTETVLIENLRSYVKLLDTKIATIKNKTQEVRAIYDAALPDTGKYFGNPINTFKLIKRMTYEWAAIRNLAWQDVTEHVVENITVFKEFLTFPTEDDLDESVGSLLRIQDVYQMEPSQVAMGEFDGMKFGSQMTWSDCFAIGQQSFNQGEHLVAKVWLQTALDKLPSDARTPQDVNARIGVLEMLANSEYQSGNIKEALRLTDEILKLNPKNKRAIAAQTTFRQKLKRKQAKPGSKAAPKTKERKLTEEQLALDVCRGTFEQYSSSKTAGRTCAYATGNLPFLSIGPVRLEVVRVDPFIVIYHNVFSDTEIEGLRSSVQDEEEWSLSSGHLKRLQTLTGYGVGRFGDWILVRNRYDDEAHFQLNAVKTSEKWGRDGVMWIQLSQPRLGGFIAFPQLEMRVNSPKGSVLYWTTRDEASDVDYRTKHLACPVIAGTLEGIYSSTMST